MKPIDRAKRLYGAADESFERDLAMCMRFGYVFATPDAILMGFRCRSDVIRAFKVGGLTVSPHLASEDGDTWFVWLAVGNLTGVLRYVPRPAKFVAFSRRNVVKLYRFEELTRLTNALTLANLASR